MAGHRQNASEVATVPSIWASTPSSVAHVWERPLGMTWPLLQAATTLSHIHSYSTVTQKPIHENEDWQTWTNEKIEVSPNKLGGALTFGVPIGVHLIYPTP